MNVPVDCLTTKANAAEQHFQVEKVLRPYLKQMDENIFAATGLKLSAYSAVCIINDQSRTTIENIRSIIGLEHSSVARLVEQLVEKDLVMKSRAKFKDKRYSCLELTETGLELSAEIKKLRSQAQTKLLEPLTKAEVELLQTLMEKLRPGLCD